MIPLFLTFFLLFHRRTDLTRDQIQDFPSFFLILAEDPPEFGELLLPSFPSVLPKMLVRHGIIKSWNGLEG